MTRAGRRGPVLEAEAELRLAVAPALVALGVVLAVRASSWTVLPCVLLAGLLAVQGKQRQYQATAALVEAQAPHVVSSQSAPRPGVYVAHQRRCPGHDDDGRRCRCIPSWRGRRWNPVTNRMEWQRPVTKDRSEVLSWLSASRATDTMASSTSNDVYGLMLTSTN